MTTIEENLKIIVDAVRHKYDAVADVDNSLNNGLGILLGFEIAVLIGYVSFGSDGMGKFKLAAATIGLMLLGISIIALLIAQFLQKKPYRYPFSVTKAKQYVQRPTEELLNYLIDEGYAAIRKNRKRRDKKKKLYFYAVRLLMVAIPFLIVARL